jgi:hypothetical protein
MGPGHLGVAFAAKTVTPKVPLWVLLAASEALDGLCFGLMAVGVEHGGATQVDLSHGLRVLTPASIP